MASINIVCISGNLVRDCELRRTQAGMAIASFSVAVNNSRKNPQTGEWESYPNFVDCTWFGNGAEKCAAALVKGARVCIEGRLHQSTWERDGQKRSKLEVIVNNIQLPPRESGSYQAPQSAEPQQSFYDDEDIPF